VKKAWAILWLVALLMAHQGAQAAPLEAIREVLRHHLLPPPDETALANLSEENLAQQLKSIDLYTQVFTPQDYRAPLAGVGMWVGIGAGLVMRNTEAILNIYKGGAADLAHVPDRSRLVAIDGQPVKNLDVQNIADRLRGEAGSTVKLTVLQPEGKQKDFLVLRTVFKPLDVELVPPGTQHVVRVRDFSSGLTRSAMRATLDFLAKTRNTNNTEPILIDLRDAPGGDLYEAFDLAGLFLSSGTPLAIIKGRDDYSMEIRAPGGPKYTMPLVLLVGPETASAAEIFAGILHQQNRAQLVGQTTYGKCSSQTDTLLPDGFVLRYTNKEVFFPNGDTCSGVGLTPDLEVDNNEIDILPRLVERARIFFP